jgi:putative hydrolase
VFAIDSDAHAPGQLDFLVLGCERAEAAGIGPDRIVNTWPKERLLAWANR